MWIDVEPLHLHSIEHGKKLFAQIWHTISALTTPLIWKKGVQTLQRHAKAASTPKYVRKPDLVYDIGLMRLYTSIVKSFI